MKTASQWRHDLRGPVTVIKGYAELIIQQPEQAKEYAVLIQKAVERFSQVLDEWKDEDDDNRAM